jgi:hypothetical protein
MAHWVCVCACVCVGRCACLRRIVEMLVVRIVHMAVIVDQKRMAMRMIVDAR